MHYLLLDLDNVLFDVSYVDKDGNVRYLWCENIEKDLGMTPFASRDFFACDTFTLDVQGDNEKLMQHTEMVLKSEKYSRHNISATEFMDYYNEKNSIFNNEVFDFFAGKKKQGHRMSIATNQTVMRKEYLLKKYPQLADLAEHIFVSSEIGHLKPRFDFFWHIRKKIELPRSEICMIDDKQHTIDVCRNMGMFDSICFRNLESLKQHFR